MQVHTHSKIAYLCFKNYGVLQNTKPSKMLENIFVPVKSLMGFVCIHMHKFES